MNTKCELSIIIPLYNCEAYIRRCLDSVYKQDFCDSDFEVIVINDGSADNSAQIVENYAKEHHNLYLINQKNAGQSVARNRGVDEACGGYVFFVDGDDMLFPHFLRKVIELAKRMQLQVLTFNSIGGVYDENIYVSKSSEISKNVDMIEDVVNGNDYIASHNYNNGPWYYVVNREFLLNSKVRFVEGRYCEDGMFTMELFLKTDRMSHVPVNGYYYLINSNGTTNNRNVEHERKMIDDFVFAIKYITELIRDNKSRMSDESELRCTCRRNSYSFFLLWRMLRFGSENVMEVIRQLKAIDAYPILALGEDYTGKKYKVILPIMNKPFLWNALCKVKHIYNVIESIF